MRVHIKILACLLSLSAVSSWGATGKFSIGGFVVNGLTNQPVIGAEIFIFASLGGVSPDEESRGAPALPSVVTDEKGRFSFPGLAQDYYKLQALVEGKLYPFVDRNQWYPRTQFYVSSNAPQQQLLLRVAPGGTLRGTIVDEFGEVQEQASVRLFPAVRIDGSIRFRPDVFASADGKGQYVFSDLAAGDYMACASPCFWAQYATSGESEAKYDPDQLESMTVGNCRQVHVSAASEITNDFKISTTPTTTVEVNSNSALFRSDIHNWAATFAADTNFHKDGPWRIENVVPGDYTAYASTGLASARKVVRVTNDPLSLRLSLEPNATLHIANRDRNGKKLEDNAAQVIFHRYAPVTMQDYFGNARAPYLLEPGEYWLEIRPNSPFCVQSLALDGTNLPQGTLRILPGMTGELYVELGAECSTIEITTARSGAVAPFANFLLLLSGTPEAPGDVLSGFTDAEGHASLSRVPPGKYRIWAWEENGDGYLGPVLGDSIGRSEELTVRAGTPGRLVIEPIRGPGR